MCLKEKILDEESSRPEPETELTTLKDINWFLFSLKCVGILPCYQVRNQYEIAAPKRSQMVYSRLVMLLKLCLLVVHVYLITTPLMVWTLTYDSNSVNFSKIFDLCLCITDFLAITAVCTTKSSEIITIFNKLLKVDELLVNNFGQEILRQTTAKYFHSKHLLGILCFTIFTFLVHFYTFDAFFADFYLHAVIFVIYIVLCSLFFIFISTVLHLLTLRFRQLNNLVTMLNQSKGSAIRPNYSQRASRRLFESVAFGSPARNTTIYRVHNLLLETFQNLNAYAGFAAFIHISYFSYVVTTTVYAIYLFKWHQRGFQRVELFSCLSAITYYINHIVLFASCCDAVAVEGTKTKQLIARFNDANYPNLVDNFLSKTLKQDVVFDAWGFFVINNAALFQIFGAITTILIIFIQFKQLEDAKTMRFL